MLHAARDPPVPPLGDAYSLDDKNNHLAEKHKEEEEETDGAVGPKNEKTTNTEYSLLRIIKLMTVLSHT